MNWDAVVAGVAGAASLGTLVVAAGLYGRTRRALEWQRRSMVDAQAHKVAAWAEREPKDLPGAEDGSLWYAVTIENSGDEAVYAVRVATLGHEDPERVYGSPIPVLPAHSRHETVVLKRPDSAIPRFELSFMDSRRSHWVRRERGGLEKVSFPADGGGIVVGPGEKRFLRRRAQVLQKEERPPVTY